MAYLSSWGATPPDLVLTVAAVPVAVGLASVPARVRARRVRSRLQPAVGLPAWRGLTERAARRLHLIPSADADATLATVVEQVAGSLRSGASLVVALEEAAERGPTSLRAPLDAVVRSVERGAGLADALASWHRQDPRPTVGLVTASLTVAAELGGSPAAALDGLAVTLRDRHQARRDASAGSAQVRASLAVLIGAPPVFGLVAAVSDPGVRAFFTASMVGPGCVALAVLLDVVGAFWMVRLTARAQR